jgi:hypothetical protein
MKLKLTNALSIYLAVPVRIEGRQVAAVDQKLEFRYLSTTTDQLKDRKHSLCTNIGPAIGVLDQELVR